MSFIVAISPSASHTGKYSVVVLLCRLVVVDTRVFLTPTRPQGYGLSKAVYRKENVYPLCTFSPLCVRFHFFSHCSDRPNWPEGRDPRISMANIEGIQRGGFVVGFLFQQRHPRIM